MVLCPTLPYLCPTSALPPRSVAEPSGLRLCPTCPTFLPLARVRVTHSRYLRVGVDQVGQVGQVGQSKAGCGFRAALPFVYR